MTKDFNDFLSSIDVDEYKEGTMGEFIDTPIELSKVLLVSAEMSLATTLHFLKKYHQWLNDQSPNQ